MSRLSAAFVVLAAVALALPGDWWVLAFAAATLAIGCGGAAYRARGERASRRLAGALSATLAGGILVLATTKVALTIVAADRIAMALGG